MFAAFATANILVTVAALLALLLAYVLLYRPLIQRIDADTKRQRALLLLFPSEVCRAVPAITAAGRRLVDDAGSVVSSGSAARVRRASN
jgi:type II secretory pathway component PulM